MRHQIKKYVYLTRAKLLDALRSYVKKVIGSIYQVEPRKVGPFGVHRLPYPVKWHRFFEFENIIVEIGCGHGELLEFLTLSRPNDLTVGFEIISEYTRKTNKRIADHTNSLVFKADAYPLISKLFDNATISSVYILFPDPWHKKKHHKRRPIKTEWLEQVWSKLKPAGFIYFATDWEEYYEFVLHEITEFNQLQPGSKVICGEYDPSKAKLVETHYYRKWRDMGRRFQYIRLEKAV